MPHLVLEVGCEELPAHSVESAANQLADNLMAELRKANLLKTDDAPKIAGTPRRLIFGLNGIEARQEDETIDKRGPNVKAAYSADGSPAPALIGFCKSLGIDATSVEIKDDYVWANVKVIGKPAQELLTEIIPKAIQEISFAKTMRWGAGRMRFSRPLRWILATFDGKPLRFSVESVESGNESRGHRFLSNKTIFATDFDELISKLKEQKVDALFEDRKSRIVSQACDISKNVLLDDELVAENLNLCEWPIAVKGEFRVEFLELPRPVLITAMAKHEKFFPITNQDGSLTNQFISITNAGNPEDVQRGNEWVLNARFNDAKFFYDEDSKFSLEDFLSKTQRILFQEKLGTVRQRADRIAELSKLISKDSGFDEEETKLAELAGRLCKADLSCGLVSELPSLQGKIGGAYAARDGMPTIVCAAISDHYEPEFGKNLATIVCCADQSDRLAGYLGIGEIPSGSSDPFALRKAMTMLIDSQMNGGFLSSIFTLFDWANNQYNAQGISLDKTNARNALKELLKGRYDALLNQIPYDVKEAVWATNSEIPVTEFVEKCSVVADRSKNIEFVRAAKRPANIIASALKKKIQFSEVIDVKLFENESEKALYGKRDEDLAEMVQPINQFFENVMVLTDDEKVRNNRLALLKYVDHRFQQLADFTKIVIEGE